MASWLTQEWAEGVAALTPGLPPVPGASGSVSLSVSGGARKEVHVRWAYEDGVADRGAPTSRPEADLVLTLASRDAVDVFSGAVEPSVAFMRGRFKAAGDGGLLLGFLESTLTAAFDAWRRDVAALTHRELDLGRLAGETSAPADCP